ncbi:prepilin peptidase [Brachybacterium kimchii]|uniref:Prepilin peptidase n=1 Tax=Brachybacterium kimchii TaxID=2942909 RepID=A0ABY4NB62_9MICO|nr:prepilin peptidase [Brachybacterium kimchii]UQN31782.1 prepilin peptidase [Brachybacterium kimchii]
MYLMTPALWPALLAFLALSAPMVITDARHQRLPLPLNVGLLVSGLVLLPISSRWLEPGHLVSAAVSSATLTALFLVLFVIARGGLGFGDVILIAGLALFGGLVSVFAMFCGIMAGCLGTLVWSRLRKHFGKTGLVPFGPGLVLGTALIMLIPLPVGI